MENINTLKQQRSKKHDLLRALNKKVIEEGRGKTIEERNTYEDILSEVDTISERIAAMEAEEEFNQKYAKPDSEYRTDTNTLTAFRGWLNDTIVGNTTVPFKVALRADPLLTTTNADIINKTIDKIDVLYSPAEELLKSLGVKFYNNVNGNLILPNMEQDVATFVGEDVSALSADMDVATNTLTAKRVTHSQSITRETQAQTTDLTSTIIENLYNGIWNAIASRFFDELETDCATQVNDNDGTVTFENIVNLEASLGAYDLVRPAYVMRPETKAYLKKTQKFDYAQNAIWENDKVNEYSAYASPFVNADKIYFGDWSKTAIASFGDGIEIIVDPYSHKQRGVIELTAVGLFDCGVSNKRVFSIINDASTY